MASALERIRALDGVRGVAILAVLALHFTVYGGTLETSGLDGLVRRVASAGWIGVDLFFVLSGFLITRILWSAKGADGYFSRFYARRSLRIFPVYYVALAVVAGVLPALWATHDGLAQLRGEGGWYLSYLVNVQVARDGWPEFGALGHFWSLAVEEQFYLLWPAVVLLSGRRTLLWICGGVAVAAVGVRYGLHVAGNEPAAFVLLPARADALVAGAFLAIAADHPAGRAQAARWGRIVRAPAALGLAVIVALRGGLPAEDRLVAVVGYTLLAVLFTGLLAGLLAPGSDGPLARVLSARPLTFFGRYSYGLYVIHHPLLFLKPGWLSYDEIPDIAGTSLVGWALFCTGATVVTVALALVSWRVVERPFLALKERFPQPVAGASPAIAVAEPAP